MKRLSFYFLSLVILSMLGMFLSACAPTPQGSGNGCAPTDLTTPIHSLAPAYLVDTLTPTFSWEYASGSCVPDHYQIEVRDEISGLIIHTGENDGSVSYTMTEALEEGRTYAWRVAMLSGSTMGPATTWQEFYTGPICPPLSSINIYLLSPGQGEIVAAASPELSWEATNTGCSIDTFMFTVSDQPDLSTFAIHSTSPGPWTSFGTGLDYLEDCTAYYWQVTAELDGVTLSSPIGSFTTDFTGSCSFDCSASSLPLPELISPAENEIVITASPVLDWVYPVTSCEVDNFHFEVSELEDFSTLAIFGDTLTYTDFQTPITYLNNCTDYFWRVRAEAEDESGSYTIPVSFSTDFNGDCGIDTSLPQVLGMSCLSEDRMAVAFQFPYAISGEYSAQVGTQSYRCMVLPDNEEQLYCYGPAVSENRRVHISLIDVSDDSVVIEGDASSPVCIIAPVLPSSPQGCPELPCDEANCFFWDPATCSCKVDYSCYN